MDKAKFLLISGIIPNRHIAYLLEEVHTNDKLQGLSRVEKTREHHKHACGTPRDLPRNTQAQKQHIISPFIMGGKKGLTIDTTNGYDRNKAN